MAVATCRGCGRPIDWIETPAGRRMPVDPGRVTVVTDDGRVVTGRTPHWATCSEAENFRRSGAAEVAARILEREGKERG
ncbi:MAG: hypothetical protein QME79_14410, partial [Bacillota bacterium]|nr:hypothetical protein [Bacillota bacterium]